MLSRGNEPRIPLRGNRQLDWFISVIPLLTPCLSHQQEKETTRDGSYALYGSFQGSLRRPPNNRPPNSLQPLPLNWGVGCSSPQGIVIIPWLIPCPLHQPLFAIPSLGLGFCAPPALLEEAAPGGSKPRKETRWIHRSCSLVGLQRGHPETRGD